MKMKSQLSKMTGSAVYILFFPLEPLLVVHFFFLSVFHFFRVKNWKEKAAENHIAT